MRTGGETTVDYLREDSDPSDERPFESEDDGLFELRPADSWDNLETNRPEVVESVFRTLSADAQRGDNQLRRSDVNRTYLRKSLSIVECMAVEERIVAAGYQILDEDDDDTNSEEGVSSYLSEVEEKAFGRQIQLALRLPENTKDLNPAYVERILKDAEQAKSAFIVSNIRFVKQRARRLARCRHLSLEDIIQEGFLGLLHASDRYDPERPFRFKTYATWWIEQYMRRAIANCDRTIRIPVHVQEKIRRIKKAQRKLALTYGHPPTLGELAIAVGMEQEKLMKLLWLVESTDCAEGDAVIEDDTTLLSLVADSSESVFDKIAHLELRERLLHVLATLTPREAHIVQMRFGLDVDQEYTLASLGTEYNLTRERIRQIEAKAFRKLRFAVRRNQLIGFVDK